MEVFFRNTNPITLELACGKGEYAVGLGRLHPERNFIGVDIKGNRMWVGAKTALSEGLTNVAFIRTQIEKITNYFF
jgi:tRNA (guanine-N7-)-methyltransferase